MFVLILIRYYNHTQRKPPYNFAGYLTLRIRNGRLKSFLMAHANSPGHQAINCSKTPIMIGVGATIKNSTKPL